MNSPVADSRIIRILKNNSVFFGVIALALVLLIVGMLLPVASTPPSNELPWQITQGPQSTRVFGLTLGQSTLQEAQSKFQEHPEISLFISDSGKFAVEAYFDQTNLGGLRAKMVLSAALTQAELQEMYERGLRISGMSSGRKIELHPDDKATVLASAIASINYLPSATLEEAVIVQRFGEPARRVREEKNEIQHFLYPQLGLDIALNKKNKAVFQYVPPQNFSALLAPLLAMPPTE